MSPSWDPWAVLQTPRQYVLVLLNQAVEDSALLARLWHTAAYTVTVDGGTSVWHRTVTNTEVASPVPRLICGDLDSADMATVEHYRGLGARVVVTPDQDHTDFTKALLELAKLHRQGEEGVAGAEAVLAFVETGGRMDHVMGNIQSLFLATKLAPELPPVYLCSSHCISWLLPPGTAPSFLHLAPCTLHLPGQHRLAVPQPAPLHCGLVPLHGPAIVSTTGLQWDITHQQLSFGGLVSTSNSFSAGCKEVTVDTDNTLLWTMDLPHRG